MLADEYHWPPEVICRQTMYQARMYLGDAKKMGAQTSGLSRHEAMELSRKIREQGDWLERRILREIGLRDD